MITETKRKLPTEDQWEEIKTVFEGTYGQAQLLIDGYKVTLQRQLVSENQLGTVCYVDGRWKGKWLSPIDRESNTWHEESRRFFQLLSRSAYKTKEKNEWVKILGKREAKKRFDLDKKIYFRSPYWKSFNSFKRHILKENHDIEIVEVV